MKIKFVKAKAAVRQTLSEMFSLVTPGSLTRLTDAQRADRYKHVKREASENPKDVTSGHPSSSDIAEKHAEKHTEEDQPEELALKEASNLSLPDLSVQARGWDSVKATENLSNIFTWLASLQKGLESNSDPEVKKLGVAVKGVTKAADTVRTMVFKKAPAGSPEKSKAETDWEKSHPGRGYRSDD